MAFWGFVIHFSAPIYLCFQLKAVSDQLKILTQEPLMKPKKRDKLKKEKKSKERDIARLKYKSSKYKSIVEKMTNKSSTLYVRFTYFFTMVHLLQVMYDCVLQLILLIILDVCMHV